MRNYSPTWDWWAFQGNNFLVYNRKIYMEAHFSSGHNICTKLQKHNYRNWQNPEPGLMGPHQSTSWTSSFIFGSIWSYPWTKWSCLVPRCCLIVHHGMVNSAAPMVKIDLVTFQLIAISLSLSLSPGGPTILFLAWIYISNLKLRSSWFSKKKKKS